MGVGLLEAQEQCTHARGGTGTQPPLGHGHRVGSGLLLAPLSLRNGGRVQPAECAPATCGAAAPTCVIRTEVVTEIPLRFYSFHLRFLSVRARPHPHSVLARGPPIRPSLRGHHSMGWEMQC
jgi:hypothetical protein